MTASEGARAALPFTVLGGFLGAGKTTLLNHLLRHAGGERIAVLVNDFGDVSIDADLVERHEGDTITLANGCICCVLATGFAEALPELRRRSPPPDRVIVEASGVADPRRVAQYGTLPGFRLDAVVVVADAERILSQLADPRIGNQVAAQLEGADLVVLSKTDLVAAEDEARIRAHLGRMLSAVPVLGIRDGRDAAPLLLGVAARGPQQGGRAAPDAHPFETCSVVREGPLGRAAVERFVASLPPEVIRAKGILWLADAPGVRTALHVVGSRFRLQPAGPWEGQPPSSRLVLIALRGGLAGVDPGLLGGEPPAS